MRKCSLGAGHFDGCVDGPAAGPSAPSGYLPISELESGGTFSGYLPISSGKIGRYPLCSAFSGHLPIYSGKIGRYPLYSALSG